MGDAAAQLNEQFGISDAVRIVAGNGGLTKVEVLLPHAKGELYLQGGHVTSWAPAGGPDVLFVSHEARFEAGRAIRGGIPVCFPWFGAKADDATAPSHGFVRLRPWLLESVERTTDGVAVSVSIGSDRETRALWPFEFRLQLRVEFGQSLRLDLTVSNQGPDAFRVEEALHNYFAVGDVRRSRISGLDGVRYLDKVGGTREAQQSGDIDFTGETDRIYLDTSGPFQISDPALERSIRIAPENSASTVVWNPWIDRAKAFADFGDDEWTRMVCVETCNILQSAPTIPPGASHTMTAVISVR